MYIIEDGRAPNPRRVRIFLAEKNIDIDYRQIDINELDQKDAAFAQLNPLQRVPVLVLDDGQVISESVAICRYFEALQPVPSLMGATPLDQAQVEMWNRRMELNLLMPIAQVFRHSHPAMAEMEVPQVPEWAEANRPRVQEVLEIMDAELASRPFIAGDKFSIADITGLVAVQFMKPARIPLVESLKNVGRWLHEVADRPSAKA
ncbi:MAG: glutathione S-transferase [Methyloligellaceae bacterium]